MEDIDQLLLLVTEETPEVVKPNKHGHVTCSVKDQ